MKLEYEVINVLNGLIVSQVGRTSWGDDSEVIMDMQAPEYSETYGGNTFQTLHSWSKYSATTKRTSFP